MVLVVDGNDSRSWPSPGVKDLRAYRLPGILEFAIFGSRVCEWATVTVVALLATWATHDWLSLVPISRYVNVAWLSGVTYAVIAELLGCYDTDVQFSLRNAWPRIITAWVGSCLLLLTLAFVLKTSDTIARSWTAVLLVSVGIGLTLARGVNTIVLQRFKRAGVFNQRLAIFGSGPQADPLASYLESNHKLTIDIVGWYGVSRSEFDYDNAVAYRGEIAALLSDIRASRIDQVIITLPLAASDNLETIISQLSMLPVLVRLAPDLANLNFGGRSFVMLGALPLMTLFERPLNGTDQLFKRVEDLLLSVLLLIAFIPLFLILSIAIKFDSPGPVFFRQIREGYNHETFLIWKFRTLHVQTLEFDNIRQVTAGDQRVTRIGRILRATSLDEIPQLINVFTGDMSLVGPRPHAASTTVDGILFREAANNYAARHRVKPGMTGWAQVNGWRGETDTGDKLLKRIEFDLFYIEHWSIWFDIHVLIRTFGAVLFPKSAV